MQLLHVPSISRALVSAQLLLMRMQWLRPVHRFCVVWVKRPESEIPSVLHPDTDCYMTVCASLDSLQTSIDLLCGLLIRSLHVWFDGGRLVARFEKLIPEARVDFAVVRSYDAPASSAQLLFINDGQLPGLRGSVGFRVEHNLVQAV